MKISEMSLKDRFDDLLDYILSTKQNAEEDSVNDIVKQIDLIYKRVRKLKLDILDKNDL